MLPGDDFLDLDLNDVARRAGGPFQQGSVEVIYYGKELEMGAQVVIRDLDRGLLFDEQLSFGLWYSRTTKSWPNYPNDTNNWTGVQ